ncbi:MAG: tol-pal system protein YbgF [Gammaproteobacteria bacterium]|nr:tol-pal system protein YbgF [Gammaproteobacteria bacterium]
MHRKFSKVVIAIFIGLSLSSVGLAQDTSKMSVEERLKRLEQLLASQGLVDIMLKVESLQTEIQRLQGQSEEQLHTLQELKKRQRDLYIDIDRRLLQLERNAPAGSAISPGAAAAAGATAAQPSGAKPTTKSTTAVTAGAMTAAPLLQGEQQAYQDAFNLLRELRYDKATLAFRDFLKNYPNGRYAHIAQYWLGEASYAQGKFKQAIKDYQTLIDNHPNSPKLAEAMLKIGYSQYELKNYKAAQGSLEQLIKTYPGTTEAGQAKNLLKKIRLKSGK